MNSCILWTCEVWEAEAIWNLMNALKSAAQSPLVYLHNLNYSQTYMRFHTFLTLTVCWWRKIKSTGNKIECDSTVSHWLYKLTMAGKLKKLGYSEFGLIDEVLPNLWKSISIKIISAFALAEQIILLWWLFDSLNEARIHWVYNMDTEPELLRVMWW